MGIERDIHSIDNLNKGLSLNDKLKLILIPLLMLFSSEKLLASDDLDKSCGALLYYVLKLDEKYTTSKDSIDKYSSNTPLLKKSVLKFGKLSPSNKKLVLHKFKDIILKNSLNKEKIKTYLSYNSNAKLLYDFVYFKSENFDNEEDFIDAYIDSARIDMAMDKKRTSLSDMNVEDQEFLLNINNKGKSENNDAVSSLDLVDANRYMDKRVKKICLDLIKGYRGKKKDNNIDVYNDFEGQFYINFNVIDGKIKNIFINNQSFNYKKLGESYINDLVNKLEKEKVIIGKKRVSFNLNNPIIINF